MNIKTGAKQTCLTKRDELIELSHRIHANPEIGFEEEKASAWLCEYLSNNGFNVKQGIGNMPTAFTAKYGSGPLHVAICAEYDALPGIGHACGHNIIAAMSVGAGIAAAKVADEAGLTVSVIGTPAEEIGNDSGKIRLLEDKVFDGVHASMMAHPTPFDSLMPRIISASMFNVHYHGKEAHASAFPELGINAADALTVAQTAIGLLRQHIKPTDRIHGIITNGGDAPNIIPAHTSARYIIRGQTIKELEELRPKVHRCFEAGAIATGSKLEIVGGDKPYTEMLHDHEIVELYRQNAVALGRSFPDLGVMGEKAAASTDMGNVSFAMPSIHPFIGIDSFPAVNHQPEFTAHCVTGSADKAIMDGAVALAWTAIDLASTESVRTRLINRA